MFTSYLPIENFERMLAKFTVEECERLIPILENTTCERDILRILNREFDLTGKGFHEYGFAYNVALPDGWDFVVPALNSNYDIFKRFPVNTNRVNGREETFSIFWNQDKYYDRMAESQELPEDFAALMEERLMAGLKMGGWTVLPARHSGELCVVTKDGYELPAAAPAAEKVDDRLAPVHDEWEVVGKTNVPVVPVVPAVPVVTNKDKVQTLLRTLSNEIPLIWNWVTVNGVETAQVNVSVRKLLDRKANVDDCRRRVVNQLRACTLITMKPIIKGQERNGCEIVVKV